MALQTMFEYMNSPTTTPDMSGPYELKNSVDSYKTLMTTIDDVSKVGTALFKSQAEKENKQNELYQDLIEKNRADSEYTVFKTQLKAATSSEEYQNIYLSKNAFIADAIKNKTQSASYLERWQGYLKETSNSVAENIVTSHEEAGAKALVADAQIVLQAGGNVTEAIDAFSTLYKISPAKLQQTFLNAFSNIVNNEYDLLQLNPAASLKEAETLDEKVDTFKSLLSNNYFYGSKSEPMQKALTDIENLIKNKKEETVNSIKQRLDTVVSNYKGDEKGPTAFSGDLKSVRDALADRHWNNPDQAYSEYQKIITKTKEFDKARSILLLPDSSYNQVLKANNSLVKEWVQDKISGQALTSLAAGDAKGFIDITSNNGLLVNSALKDLGTTILASNNEQEVKSALHQIDILRKQKNGMTAIVQSFGPDAGKDLLIINALSKVGVFGKVDSSGKNITSTVDLKNTYFASTSLAATSQLSRDDYTSLDKAHLGVFRQYAVQAIQMAKTLGFTNPSVRDSIIKQFSNDTKSDYYDNINISGKTYEVTPSVKNDVITALSNMVNKYSRATGVSSEDISFIAKDTKNIQLVINGVEHGPVINLPKLEQLMLEHNRQLPVETLQGKRSFKEKVENALDNITATVATTTKHFMTSIMDPDKSKPIWMRSHNPGNLRYNENTIFKGVVGNDNGFARFSSPTAGLRAMYLNTYNGAIARNYSLTDYISRYAPKEDNNNTVNYIRTVASMSGVKPGEKITEKNIDRIIQGMIMAEGGPTAVSTYAPYFLEAHTLAKASYYNKK